jgi:hypothetical protein
MKDSLDKIWGFVAGLLIGAGVFGHALRLVILESNEITPRHYVAGFAVLLYSVSGLLTYFRKKSGLYIAILGPVGGITAVSLAPNAQIDTFQIVLGIPQMLAVVMAIYILTKEK